MKRYVYFQPNDKDLKDRVGDCAIRAICKATNQTWLETFDGLCEYARNAQCLPNQEPAYKPYLEIKGWHYISIAKKKMSVSDVAKMFTLCDSPFILYIRTGYRTHMVTIQGGKYFDTWDSGNKLVYGYWSKED